MTGNCIWITQTESETKQIASRLASHLQAGAVLALEGDLGAGKTAFAKGLAEGLEVRDTVDSPTFTLIKEYQGRLPFYHLDVYRLGGFEADIGLEEYLYGDGICLVEWASYIRDWLPEDTVWLHIQPQLDGSRKIQMKSSYLCREMQT